MFSLLGICLIAAAMDPALLKESHLIEKIRKNEEYCVLGYEENKIFLDPSKVSFSAQGPVLDLNGQESVLLPLLTFDDARYVLEHGFSDLFSKEQTVCSHCLKPVDATQQCQNSQCLFYGFLVKVSTLLKKEVIEPQRASPPPKKLGDPPFPVALYVDNATIGFPSTTPPTGGLLISGSTSIGSSSAAALFNVGSSNQFQVSSGGVASAPQLNLNGASSGTISILPQAAAGTYNFNLPTDAGMAGYLLTSGGGGATAMTWTDPSASLVTSVSGTANQIAASSAMGDVTLSFTDGISIGSYQATSPPTGGIICPGRVTIGNNPSIGYLFGTSEDDANVYAPSSASVATPNGIRADFENSNTTTGTASLLLFTTRGNTAINRSYFGLISTTSGGGQFVWGQRTGTISYAERMRMDLSGNLGIGTTTPQNRLDVSGAMAIGSYAGVNAAPANGMICSGNVGIGINNPASTFHVQTTATGQTILERTGQAGTPTALTVRGTGNFSTNRGIALDFDIPVGGTTGTGARIIAAGSSLGTPRGYLSFSNEGGSGLVENMRIEANGDVGMGTTTPQNRLDVSGAMAIGSYAGVNTAPANGMICSGNVGIGTNNPLTACHIVGSAPILEIQGLTVPICRIWASTDSSPGFDAVLQLGNKTSTSPNPDSSWYIGLDGDAGPTIFSPPLKIGRLGSGWGVPGSGDIVTIDWTDGRIHVTNNLVFETAGAGLYIREGTNAKMGTATLNGTTPVAVATTVVTANSRIFLTINTPGGTVGSPYVSGRSAGVSFSVASTSGTDTSIVAWLIIEPSP